MGGFPFGWIELKYTPETKLRASKILLGVFGVFLGRLGHRTAAIVPTRIPGISTWRSEFFKRLTETPVNRSKLCWYRPGVVQASVWALYFLRRALWF